MKPEPEGESRFQVNQKDWYQQLHKKKMGIGHQGQKADERCQGIQEAIALQKSDQTLARKRPSM